VTAQAAVDLTDPHKKDIAMQLVSSAENSSLDWKAQYGYIEDIDDATLGAIKDRLHPTSRHADLATCDAIVICVPTPLTSAREPDLTYLLDAASSIAQVLQPEQLVVLGVPLDACISAAEDVTRHAHGVARRYVRLYLDEVWRPFEEAGRPEADWPRMQDTLERMRPLALDSLAAAFRLVMGAEVDRAYNQVRRRRAGGREEGAAAGGAARRRAEPVSG